MDDASLKAKLPLTWTKLYKTIDISSALEEEALGDRVYNATFISSISSSTCLTPTLTIVFRSPAANLAKASQYRKHAQFFSV